MGEASGMWSLDTGKAQVLAGQRSDAAADEKIVPISRGTRTSAFGVSRRENHDASAFYARFEPPILSTDDAIVRCELDEPLIVGDARHMDEIADNSVALVVTSPPYYAGKEYEQALGEGDIPGSYLEYLRMLEGVFAECVRKLEPGGRIAVNVANLGRKPYRSLSADVINILQDRLHLLLRGEVIWQKAKGASGSVAWGSFRSPANPVLRDVTERVVIASKGRFDRAKALKKRRADGLPNRNPWLSADEFMEATLDVWGIPAENATRVGHPAPFPVELPQRLIHLYTYEDDLVLDPFIGSGTTAVAAVRAKRRYAGYDTEDKYIRLAKERVADELAALAPEQGRDDVSDEVNSLGVPPPPSKQDFQARATKEGKTYQGIAGLVLERCGFRIDRRNQRIGRLGLTVNFVASDDSENMWYFDVSGAFTTTRAGLRRTDTVWKALGRANVLRRRRPDVPLVLLTSHLPELRSGGDTALHAAGPDAFFDAIEMLSDSGIPSRLRAYGTGQHYDQPLPGFWSPEELDAYGGLQAT